MEADFAESVFQRLAEVVGDTPVYWPNVTMPVPTEPHYRAAILPINGKNVATCGKTRRAWLVQITAAARAGVGLITLLQMIDIVNERFLVNSTIGQYTQIDTGNTAPVIVLDGWAFVPVTYKFEVII